MISTALNINKNQINKLAFEKKASARIPEKLWADELVVAYCMASVHDECSLNTVRAHIYKKFGISISKSGLAKRIKKNGTVELFKEIVISSFINAVGKGNRHTFKSLRKRFRRILIQDSTIVQLPSRLFKVFFGVENKDSVLTFSRIQFIYDILNVNFVNFSIDTYFETDATSASKIEVIENDLWLRDRGYFSLDACVKIANEGGDFILRYKVKTNLYQKSANGKLTKIDLVKLLKKNPHQKIRVLVGNDLVPMNLVTAPADQKIANERRRKATEKYGYGTKGKSNSKKDMTPEYYFLCGFTIFLTSTKLDLNYEEIYALYCLRWRIEIIFKTWKSNLNFDKIHNVSMEQFYILMYCRLIINEIIYTKFYNVFLELVLTTHNKIISIMALTKHLMIDLSQNLKDLKNGKIDYLITKFSKFCTYDKRKRKNYFEKEQDIFTILDIIYAK